jgi:acylphosphatase
VIVRFRAVGRVQGVGYRAFAEGQARALNLGGWVRNDPDGAVSGEAEGSAEQLAAYQSLLRSGPPWGKVEALTWIRLDEGDAGAAQSLPRPFQVRR